jgi:SAM-dependent methyltransferase
MILDVGCGLGSSTISIAKAGFDVLGIDISKTAIEEASHRFKEFGIPHSALRTGLYSLRTPNSALRIGNIRFKVQDVFNMKPLYGKFDIVTDIACLHCFDGKWRKAYLKEIHRTLKPNGLYWVMTFGRKAPDYGPYRYSQKEMRELTSPLFKTLFIRNADWSRLYQRNPSEIQSVSCLFKKT